jgi:hypothetical protein
VILGSVIGGQRTRTLRWKSSPMTRLHRPSSIQERAAPYWE